MDHVWLHNEETGGYFRCPESALRDWLGLGWQRSDPPPPAPSPVVAERIGWEQEQQRREAAPQTKTRRSAAGTEGVGTNG